MIKFIRQLYFKVFPSYRRLEMVFVDWGKGDALIRASEHRPEPQKWVLALPEEDRNRVFGMVYLERRIRITE